MKLDEFHVRDPAAGAPGHCNSIARRGVRIGGVEIDLARATGSQHSVTGINGDDLSGADILHIQAQAAGWRFGQAELVGCDQINGEMMFKQGNVRMFAHLLFEGQLHRMAGRIRCVDDAPLTMSTFAGEMKAEFRLFIAGEGYALCDQPFDRLAALPRTGWLLRGVSPAESIAEHTLGVALVASMLVDDLRTRLTGVGDVILVSVGQLDAVKTAQLRQTLRKKRIHLQLIKNSLARRATEGTPLAPAFSSTEGMLAIAWGGEDVVDLAKELDRLTGVKGFEGFECRGGALDGSRLESADVKKVAKWPTRSEQLSLLSGQILSIGGRLSGQILAAGGTLAGQIASRAEELAKASGEPAA